MRLWKFLHSSRIAIEPFKHPGVADRPRGPDANRPVTTLSHVARRDLSVHDTPLTKLRAAGRRARRGARVPHRPVLRVPLPEGDPAVPGPRRLVRTRSARTSGRRGRLLTARRDGRIVGVARLGPARAATPIPAPPRSPRRSARSTRLYRIPTALREGTALPHRDREGAPERGPLVPPAARVRPRAPAHRRRRRAHGGRRSRECDDEGVAAYLETQNEDNLAYYRGSASRSVDAPVPRARRAAAVGAAPRAARRRGRLTWRSPPRSSRGRSPGVALDQATDVAVRAFDDDPFFSYLFPRPRQRHRSVGRLHRAVISHLAPVAITRTALLDGKVVGRRAVGPARASGRTRR